MLMNKYVTSHYDEVNQYGETRCDKTEGTSNPPLSSPSSVVVQIDQRKWNDILAVDYVDEVSLFFRVSKTMTRTPRHRGLHREADVAMEWNIL